MAKNIPVEKMNWLQIDAILWDMISQWDGTQSDKKDILENIRTKFKWSEKQTTTASDMHFNLYNKIK